MSAVAILKRYIHRNSGLMPDAPSGLREHLASVAKRGGLRVTEKELDELTPQPPEGGVQGQPVFEASEKPKEAKKRRNKAATPKTGA